MGLAIFLNMYFGEQLSINRPLGDQLAPCMGIGRWFDSYDVGHPDVIPVESVSRWWSWFPPGVQCRLSNPRTGEFVLDDPPMSRGYWAIGGFALLLASLGALWRQRRAGPGRRG